MIELSAARERYLMGSGRLSGGLLGQLGSSVGINSSNIGNAFIGVLIVIVVAIIVSAVYTHSRTKSKLTRAKLSSQKSSSLSSLHTQSISALADGLQPNSTRYDLSTNDFGLSRVYGKIICNWYDPVQSRELHFLQLVWFAPNEWPYRKYSKKLLTFADRYESLGHIKRLVG